MSEPTPNGPIVEAQSLDDLGEVTIRIEVPRPDGRKLRIRLRTLGDDEAWQIRQLIQWPDAPVTDFQKVNGEALPVRDYQNKDYLKARREAERDLAYCNIAASLLMDIPGDTLLEKGQAVEKKIGRWAYDYLLGVINRLNFIEQEAIDRVANSFRYETPGGAAGDGRVGTDARAVAELIEG